MSERSSSTTSSFLPSGLLLGGVVAVFLGQRVLGGTDLDQLVSAVGGLLCLAALGLRVVAFLSAEGDVKGVEARFVGAYLAMVVGVGFYGLSTDAGLDVLGLSEESAARAGGVLTVAWMAIATVSAFAVLFMELSYARMPLAESVELRRVRTALHAGVSLALAVVFLLSVNYVATARDVRKDVSYFKTAMPSSGTRSMVDKLDQPLHVFLLYRANSDVLAQVEPYFQALSAASDKLSYEVTDIALAPELGRKHRVRDNGFVLLVKGEGDEAKGLTLEVGDELTRARRTLRKLDAEFQATFSKLVQPERKLFLTVGHGERNTKQGGHQAADGTSLVSELLRRINLKTDNLGLSQGLGSAVPDGASAVAILGPTEPFMKEEVDTLLGYVRSGGRLLLCLDPDVDTGLTPLLEGLGVQLLPGTALSETHHMRRTHTQSDRGIVYANSYTSHPIVTNASRHQREVATVFVNGGGLDRFNTTAEPKPKVTFPLRSAGDFWRDLNGNFVRDGEEKLQALNLMAAVSFDLGEGKWGRAVIVGDGDFITNKLAGNNGNALPFIDSLAWLIGNEDLSGEVASEEDIPIEHSQDEDKIWFYATTFAMPAPVLAIGLLVARSRRRRSEVKS